MYNVRGKQPYSGPKADNSALQTYQCIGLLTQWYIFSSVLMERCCVLKGENRITCWLCGTGRPPR